MNIFTESRIRLNELYLDSIDFVSASYGKVGQYFSMASPMGQLLQNMLNYGRMILFYIEDSITELNILTASRPNSIKGLARLTGHNPSRSMAARGTLRLQFNGEKIDAYSSVVTIPNYTTVVNKGNGLKYTIILPGEDAKLNLTSTNNFINVNVLQGTLEYQQATGTGAPLQSFNFSSKKGASIDNYHVNVYVNGKKWQTEESILDMTFDSETCLVKTGQTGGLDVFFGNTYNGKIPVMGSTILVDYLVTDGAGGNINKMTVDNPDQWSFKSSGYSQTGEPLDLNKFINVSIKNTILFGTQEEPIYLTRLLAPHASRSFVLANTNSYIYFLRKLNVFTIIDAIPGFATSEDQYARDKSTQATDNKETLSKEYNTMLQKYGPDSPQSKATKVNLDKAIEQVFHWAQISEDQKKDDNTIYLFLVPDINKRIPSGSNYYNCDISAFKLSGDEKRAILDLIEESGQRVLTVDNAILEIKYPKFVVNMSLLLWEGYDYDNVRETILSKTSEYFLRNTRRDRIPVSDLIKVVEDVEGVDSVNLWFDADKNNKNIYLDNYGLDEYGDIILERKVLDAWDNTSLVKDVYGLIRGGFTSATDVYYEDGTSKESLSTVNIQVRGYTPKDLNQKHNQAILNNI